MSPFAWSIIHRNEVHQRSGIEVLFFVMSLIWNFNEIFKAFSSASINLSRKHPLQNGSPRGFIKLTGNWKRLKRRPIYHDDHCDVIAPGAQMEQREFTACYQEIFNINRSSRGISLNSNWTFSRQCEGGRCTIFIFPMPDVDYTKIPSSENHTKHVTSDPSAVGDY